VMTQRSVPVVVSDSKTTCPEKTWAALAAAARRRASGARGHDRRRRAPSRLRRRGN
jgi:hypothetical protein